MSKLKTILTKLILRIKLYFTMSTEKAILKYLKASEESDKYFSNYKDGFVVKYGKSQRYSYKDYACYRCCWDKILYFDNKFTLYRISEDVVEDIDLFVQGKITKLNIKTIPSKEILEMIK